MENHKTLTIDPGIQAPAPPEHAVFDEHEVIHELKHYLPAQAPLKDFIHHNTLHAFQAMRFSDALRHASEMFGYKTSLSIDEYRKLYNDKQIREDILEMVVTNRKGSEEAKEWIRKVRFQDQDNSTLPRIGALRSYWKKIYRIDLDSQVHPFLFRLLCSYLDQGISIWGFPVHHKNFLSSLREMERTSFTSFFKTKRAREILLHKSVRVDKLLKIVVGDETLYKQYLFDQQFSHQGWSGIVSVIEDNPHSLLDQKKISLHDLICLELLLEIDVLDDHFGETWQPLSKVIGERPVDLFADVKKTDYSEILALWQEAYEWSYYDQVLAGISINGQRAEQRQGKKFQALFCIDDREFSLQHYLEKNEPECATFGTPGFFNVEFYYQPLEGKFFTKLCPAPVTPKYLIKEVGSKRKHQKDPHFTKYTHTLFRGWLTSQALGFWSAVKLFISIFKPTVGPATTTSFSHMDKVSKLTIENKHDHHEKGLQVGFTVAEMTTRVEGLLKSIGLVDDFAPIVYVVGHGSSSVNNPHYAAYDCGACSGRPGSVNARVFSFMANHREVRKALAEKGIIIPEGTQFVGALHDTSRDEIAFYDEDSLSNANKARHLKNEMIFTRALASNAKERARRFELMNHRQRPEIIADRIKLRSVSLFEPRPELNHATNSLCIVGRRTVTRNLFLDRRAFLNSYDYRVDPEGNSLLNILKAAAPVCGGINLEYFFSRVDNQKLGAGTKLPHNVMGLFGVANGIDGDLRPGLPSQMIEVHDPIRLLIIVEHYPDVVLRTIQRSPETYEWFIYEWIHLVAIHPDTQTLYRFDDGGFAEYHPTIKTIGRAPDTVQLIENHSGNIPVHLIA